MGLQLYNPRPKNDHLIGLGLTPLAEIKTCVASIGGGGIMADVAYSAFQAVALPAVVILAGSTIAFLAGVDFIQDKMIQHAMDNGDVRIRTWRRPKIDI